MYSIILRHRNERTLPLIRKTLRNAGIFTMLEVTSDHFSHTLKQSLDLGLSLPDEWVIMLDGDVIPSPLVLKFLIDKISDVNRQCFVVVPSVFDKSFMMIRKAGVHVYRKKYLLKLLNILSKLESVDRPETEMNLIFQNEGYTLRQSNLVVGYHDFEQFYKDLWLKGFTFAKKSRFWVRTRRNIWENKINSDKDFRVLMDGFDAGLSYEGPIVLSRNITNYIQSELALEKLHILEKEPLIPNNHNINQYMLKILAKNLNKLTIKEGISWLK